MPKGKNKKGSKLFCIWCGREVIISNFGISDSKIWCCARPMLKKTPSLMKKYKAILPAEEK